jgi:uncharacterized protein (TIGR03083 family)
MTALAQRSPRASALDRPVALRLAATEYTRFNEALSELSTADWSRPTDCADWDVRAMAGHVLGMAEMAASLPEQARQMRAARRAGGSFIDALTALQVAKHAADEPGQIVAAFERVAPRAATGRRRTPGLVRGRRLPFPQDVDGVPEDWTIGFLVDVILTRDTWMHRLDLALATGRPPRLTAGHDGVLVADIVAEWAGRHGQPCRLTLTGPAGGEWTWGADGPLLESEATEFCRVLSGRGQASGLLAVQVPF